jgi:hypothetical protein
VYRRLLIDSFTMAQQPLVIQDLLIDASRSHSDAQQGVGPLWTSDHSDGGTSTGQHTTLTADLYRTTHNIHSRPLPDNTQHSQQTSTGQHTTLTTDLYRTTHNTHNRPLPDDTQHSQQTRHPCPGEIRTHNPSKLAAAQPRVRPP